MTLVVQNSNGILIDGVAKRVWSYSPLAAEARALLETLRLALARGS